MLKHSFIFILIAVLALQACKTNRISRSESTTDINPTFESAFENRELLHPAQGMEKGNCEQPLTELTFQNTLNFLKQEKESTKRLNLAKNVVESACLTSYQWSRVLELFVGDSFKLELAKYAYERIYDRANYEWVSQQLALETNRLKLETFIKESNLD